MIIWDAPLSLLIISMDLYKQMSLCWLLIFTCISHLSYWHQINWRWERCTRYIITKGGFELFPNWFNIAKKLENFNNIVTPDLFGFGLCPPNRIIFPIFAKKISVVTRVKNKIMIFCVFPSLGDNEWGLISDRRVTDTDHFAHCVWFSRFLDTGLADNRNQFWESISFHFSSSSAIRAGRQTMLSVSLESISQSILKALFIDLICLLINIAAIPS